MMTRMLGALAVVVACCCAAAQMSRPASADERGKKVDGENPKNGGITFEAVLEEVDGNTITARAYHHVIPPSGSAGGMVYSGHLPDGAKAARDERLPVMPEAGIKDKKLRHGMRVNLTLDTIKGGVLVVTGVEERTDLERIGVDAIDAPKGGR